MKRLFDVLVSTLALLLLSPLLIVVCIIIWMQDRRSPLFISQRVGRWGKLFAMVKFRSMVMDADKSGVDSTRTTDARITPIGRIIRRSKVDELPQLWNVLRGNMSLVGPRPQVERDVWLYTNEERHLLAVRPGMTDLSSIVFADEGDILELCENPDIAYNQLIRPWKSRLGLFYVRYHSFLLDIRILLLTMLSLMNRSAALTGVGKILRANKADEGLIAVAARRDSLSAVPPPGMARIVTTRDERPEGVSTSLFDLSSITEDWETLATETQRRAVAIRYGLCGHFATGRRFLDVGCGTGFGMEVVAANAAVAVGVDAMASNVDRCNIKCQLATASVGDATRLPFPPAVFDVVALLESLYYIDDQMRAIREMARVAAPGGKLIITVPNPDRPRFHPSPGSTHYPTLAELASLVGAVCTEVECYGAFAFDRTRSVSGAVVEFGRRVASVLHLIPKTIEGRGRLKAKVQRNVKPLSTFAEEDIEVWTELQPLRPSDPKVGYIVLYVVGTTSDEGSATSESGIVGDTV